MNLLSLISKRPIHFVAKIEPILNWSFFVVFADVDASAELKFQCPLCQEKFGSQEALEAHAFSVHSVNAEGLQRLQSLISGSHWLNKNQDAASTSSDKGMFDSITLPSKSTLEQTPVGVQFVDVGFDFIVVGTNKI